MKTGEFGARTRSTRRPVVGLAGAEDKVAALLRGIVRRAGQFDVIDLGSVGSRDALTNQLLPDAPGVIGKTIDIGNIQSRARGLSVRKNQLPPQATSPDTVPMPGTSTATL